ncbi:MFS transporter [Ottowia sp. GY511]|uniref:MFS transporter n=1 Tax=Ottowia flava TaxID=2675430 RepID=A0ABW4KTY7_9BURK|nr:MFS transporter [Ottowia sp. GY511]TXK23577.1 MFS transporter [Ottowia sp. GY511]
MSAPTPSDASLIDSRTAAWRLFVTVLLVTLGNSAMYVVSVVLPAVQTEFGISRAYASLPYTAMMVCLGLGGLWTGKWADRWGIARVLWLGSAAVAAGYILAAASGNVWLFGLAHGLLGLLGGAATFAPLMADTGLWWQKRRGIAMAVCASGNYIAGTIWPPLAQWGITHYGWRPTYVALGLVCGIGMALLAFAMRRPPPELQIGGAPGAPAAPRPTPWPPDRPFGLTPGTAQALLCVAGVACCVAMSMPQVHIVAYCTDLGFGAARGAEMLSLMLFSGIISRLVSGWICDHIGGIRTLLLGSALQGLALLMFLPASGMMSLYAVSAMFGLFQGGIVPSYAIIVREHFPAREAGARTGALIMATLIGMALGGWMSGWVFDVTGSYRAAFLNGIGWNLLNLGIVGWLYLRTRGRSVLRAHAG